MAFEPGDKIGGLTDGELAAFLAHPWNARIATITRDGWPYVTPVWYELDVGARRVLVVGREHARWVADIRENPRVALEGPVAPRASARLLELTHRLSLRYLGPDGPAYAERTLDRPRVLVSLSPVRWTSWTGREWHPRYR
jgi:hypothetical protein